MKMLIQLEGRQPEIVHEALHAVLDGEPGVDFRGPDALMLVGLPGASICALRVESRLD